MHESGSEVRLVPEDLAPLSEEERRPLLDIVLLSTQAMLETVVGHAIDAACVALPYAPHDYTRRYSEWFRGQVRFECAAPAVVFPTSWLSLASPLGDQTLFDAAVRSLLMRERALYGDRRFALRVEELLARRGSRLDQGATAALLGVSSRTLSRRLAAEGTTFQSLLDESRRERAALLLRNSELGVAEIAYALGYEDAANFGRAFRRWFGTSPGRYRVTGERGE